MKVLVTGGAGFIGSHVCDRFLRAGHSVIAVDDLSSGRKENLDPRVTLVVADIRDQAVRELILRERPGAVCHLAAQIDVRKSVESPHWDAEINILGTLNVLGAAREAGVKKVVFSSTGGAIYGEQDAFPATEEHATRPLSPYGVSKRCGELYLGFYRAQFGLAYTALRYANVYGPRQNSHGEAGVVAIFSERLAAGQPCTIYGDGEQTRDFVYVEDVAEANLLASATDFVGELNVGTGRETSVNELYRLLAQGLGSSLSPARAPGKPGEQRRSCISSAKAERVLGWRPAVALEEGIARTVAYFRRESAPR